jgi:hypothetical protein
LSPSARGPPFSKELSQVILKLHILEDIGHPGEGNKDIDIAAFVLFASHERAEDAELTHPVLLDHFRLVLFEDRFCFLDISH